MKSRGSSNLAAMTVSNTIAVTANGIWIMFMPYYFEQLLGTPEFVGFLFSGVALSSAVFYPIGGRLADRIGHCTLVMFGRLVATLGPLSILFLQLVAPHFEAILIGSIVGYLIVFIGGGLRLPAASMLIMESSQPKKKSRNYMIVERVLPSIPPALTVYVGAQLYVYDQLELMLLLGAIGLALSAVALLPIREIVSLEEPTERSQISGQSAPIDGIILVIAFAFVLDGISSKGLSWYVPLFLGEENALLYGLLISVSTLVIAMFSLISGIMVDRVGIRASLIPGWIALAITVTLFGLVVNPIYSLILYCIWVALDTVDTSIPPLIISNLYPKNERATRMGLFSMIIRSSLFAGPLLVAVLISINPQFPFLAKALMNLVAALVILRFVPKREQS